MAGISPGCELGDQLAVSAPRSGAEVSRSSRLRATRHPINLQQALTGGESRAISAQARAGSRT